MNLRHRYAFTLVELLVVIAIIGILIALALPAIQASRETARQAQCTQHLQQIAQGLSRYYAAYECFPAGVESEGGPIKNEPKGRHIGWICPLLPYLDAEIYYRKLDLSESVYAPANDEVRRTRLSVVQCPSFPRMGAETPWAVSHYAGCYHDQEAPIDVNTQGAFALNRWLTQEDFADGLNFTLFVAEKGPEANDLGWASGTRATLRNAGHPPAIWGRPLPGERPSSNNSAPPGQAQSDAAPTQADHPSPAPQEGSDPLLAVGGYSTIHPGVIQALLGTQTVKPIALTISPQVWQQLANRNDGSLPALETP